ncbi:MAG TPA: alpha/beta fold hydrolase [Ktedonobacteraceae bacterium]|jgi:pimeloyl-ACP methyl ester carboxylesterase
MAWFVSIIVAAAGLGLAIWGVMVILGRRFLQEFTRPGVTIEYGTEQWGGWTFPVSTTEPPQDLQRVVIFSSADGTRLRGEFWAQTHRAPTIIISHGFHFPSRYFRSVAALEYAHGANILLFDFRGHGESEHVMTTCGNAEIKDLVAAVEVAARQAETAPSQIYIHGFSMGAAVALLLPPHPAVAGIIADSPYARLDEMIRLLIGQVLAQETARWRGLAKVVRPLLPALAHLMLLGGQALFFARYRYSLVARPDQALGIFPTRQALRVPETLLPAILLIHAEHDPLIALHHAHRLVTVARAAGRAIQAYYTPCDIHCGSYGHDPHRYMSLLRNFMMLESVPGLESL